MHLRLVDTYIFNIAALRDASNGTLRATNRMKNSISKMFHFYLTKNIN